MERKQSNQRTIGWPANLPEPRTSGINARAGQIKRERGTTRKTKIQHSGTSRVKGEVYLVTDAAHIAKVANNLPLTREELLTRTKGIQEWIRANRNAENFKGVAIYQLKLLKLLSKSKPSIN